MRNASRKAAWLAAAALSAAAAPALAQAAPSSGTAASGDLFFTTTAAFDTTTFGVTTATVDSVHFTWDGTSSLQLSAQKSLATLPQGQNADGIIFDKAGNLLVASAGLKVDVTVPFVGTHIVLNGTNQIDRFTTAGAPVGSTPTPDGPFHLSLSPDGKSVFSGGTFGTVNLPFVGPVAVNGDAPGNLVKTPADLSSGGVSQALSGDTTALTQIAFAPSGGKVFYTSAPNNGNGDYGTIDLATGKTTKIGALPAAHGIIYDSFSGDFILTGANHVTQIDASTGSVVSDLTLDPSLQLDQGSVDGKGHLFVGDNNGKLVFVDYSHDAGKLLTGGVTETPFLASHLDDLAPLSGAGGPPVGPPPPPPAVPLPAAGWMGLVMMAGLFGASTLKSRRFAPKA